AVAGSHGKTTTTSMIAHVLSAYNLDPTMIIGGRVRSLGTNAKMGQGEFLVAEADESDGSFLVLAPTIAVVTNIDREHLDFHQTMERLNESFLNFVNRIPFYGLAVLCLDNANVQALLPKVKKRCVTYGLSAQADYSAREIKMSDAGVEFAVIHQGQPLGTLRLRLLGRHSATNALAVVAVAQELEVPFARIAEALAEFSGIHRRFEVKGEAAGVLVLDDYGHHPTEVRATVSAIRDSWKRPLTVIFQPHRFSRTQDLFEDFVTAFDGADRLLLTDIYAAGEDAIAGVSSEALYQAIKKHRRLEVTYVPANDAIAAQLKDTLKEGDIVLTLGAGDVYKVGEALVAALKVKMETGSSGANE
ncbi:MAG: UDP-N-acetylmuramate--L-alanine ligase, partial [Deltaproteobacteria bacterium]|nr:UDP-N-acetylmuramate--L-alanine ligase [Deltaproteobacteria bacterium]